MNGQALRQAGTTCAIPRCSLAGRFVAHPDTPERIQCAVMSLAAHRQPRKSLSVLRFLIRRHHGSSGV
jgi:hypothetical protein